MASRAHQLITGLIARKMTEKGYEVVGFDGNESIISDISLDVPPKIKRHKPDLIGVNIENKNICIGEAKTDSDLTSKRTKEQFLDFANTKTKRGNKCDLIIGVPKSSKNKLEIILNELKLNNKSNVTFIWMPDELIEPIVYD